MAYNNSFTAVVGATYTAAQYNTYVRDNFTAIWVYTTAGDIVYATSATALSRLAKPSVDSVLAMGSSGVPSWLARTSLAGIIHTAGSNFSDSNPSTTSTTFVTTGINLNLTLTLTCTVLAWAFGAARKNSAAAEGRFVIDIDGTTDSNEACSLQHTTATPFSTMYRRTGITAGTRNVALKYRTLSGSDALFCSRGILYAIAFVE